MSSGGHTAMTGSLAQVDSTTGGKLRAWDGYILGSTLELTPNLRVVQVWRISKFPEDAPDSRLEVLLEAALGGTRVILNQSDMPEEQVDSYRQGWKDSYFKPMKDFWEWLI